MKLDLPNLEDLRVVNFQWLDKVIDQEIISKAEKSSKSICKNRQLTLYLYMRANASKLLPFSKHDKLLVSFTSLQSKIGNFKVGSDSGQEFIYRLLQFEDEAWHDLNNNSEEILGHNVQFLITCDEKQELMIYGPFK